jgi:hypothetical protein
MPNGPTVSNSTYFIAMEPTGYRDILLQLFSPIEVPHAVAQECGSTLPNWATVRTVQNELLFASLCVELGEGEAEAIALALENSATRVILDDKKARRIARQLGLPVTGTLAIVLRAKELGLVPRVRDVLDALLANNFRVSSGLAQAVLRQANE